MSRSTLAGTLLAFLLVAATLAVVPAAEASAQACTILTSPSCSGWACVDQDGDRAFSSAECVGKDDLEIDQCQFQSDCCGGIGGGFWCPERE